MIVNMECAWRNVLYLGLVGTTFLANHTQDDMLWVVFLFWFVLVWFWCFFFLFQLFFREVLHTFNSEKKALYTLYIVYIKTLRVDESVYALSKSTLNLITREYPTEVSLYTS